jgi:hypothetical protein
MLGGILNMLVWIGLAVVIMGLVAVGVWLRSFSKIKAEVTEILSNDSRKTYVDKIRPVKDKKGRSGWQFFKTKSLVGGKSRVITEPPYKYIDLLSNGVKFVRFVKIGDELHPWHPNFDLKEVKDKEGKLAQVLNDVRTQALNTNEREAYLYEMQRANEYGGVSGWQLLEKAMPFIALVMIVFGGVILFDEVSNNLTEQQELVNNELRRTQEINLRVAESLERVGLILGGNSSSFDSDQSISGGGAPN